MHVRVCVMLMYVCASAFAHACLAHSAMRALCLCHADAHFLFDLVRTFARVRSRVLLVITCSCACL